jgi:hypothetical protein
MGVSKGNSLASCVCCTGLQELILGAASLGRVCWKSKSRLPYFIHANRILQLIKVSLYSGKGTST